MNDNVSMKSEVQSSNGESSLRGNSRMSFKKLGIYNIGNQVMKWNNVNEMTSKNNIPRPQTEHEILNRGKLAYEEQRKKNLFKLKDPELDTI